MKTDKTKDESNSEQQARAQLAGIVEMVKALKDAEESGDDDAIESAREAIQQDPLSVEVRSAWMSPEELAKGASPEEFNILLCTGGPAVRIIGSLDQYNEPENVHIQHQDWGTQWTGIVMTGKEGDALTEYCRQFYFGE